MLSLTLLIRAQEPAFSGGVAGLIAGSGLMARFVLALLLVFSLVSWAIILYKGLALRRAHSHSDTFLELFRKSSKARRLLERGSSLSCPRISSKRLMVVVIDAGSSSPGRLRLTRSSSRNAMKLRRVLVCRT